MIGNPYAKREYVDGESEKICSGHDVQRQARHALERAQVILRNMAEERPGFWASLFGRRWPIHHEPLRGDARNALPQISTAIVALIHQERK